SELSTCTQTSCLYADQVIAAKLETVLCTGYPKASRSRDITQTIIIGCTLVFPVIALRLYTRVAYTKRLWIDDYATIVAAVSIFVWLATLAILDLYSARLGLGMHYWTILTGHGILILKLFYAESMVYMLLLMASKISILLVYRRIFPARRFRYAVNLLSAFFACHGILYILLTAIQCLPVYSIWNRYVTSRKCLDATAISYSNGALSILEDVAILLLPVPQVWRLQIDRRRRLAVLAVFSIGSFACFTSMIRMKYVVQYSATFDATWDNVDIVIWSAIEQFSAMFCGSLPPLRLLLVNARRRISQEVIGNNYTPSHTPPPNQIIPSQPRRQLSEASQNAQPADIVDGASSANQDEPGKDNIQVTTTFEVRWEEGTWLEDSSQHEDIEGESSQPPASKKD
ncbi:hypothetical protein QBC43DRAFT_221924, partial [Cladorrhinum sp. PSN259]